MWSVLQTNPRTPSPFHPVPPCSSLSLHARGPRYCSSPRVLPPFSPSFTSIFPLFLFQPVPSRCYLRLAPSRGWSRLKNADTPASRALSYIFRFSIHLPPATSTLFEPVGLLRSRKHEGRKHPSAVTRLRFPVASGAAFRPLSTRTVCFDILYDFGPVHETRGGAS